MPIRPPAGLVRLLLIGMLAGVGLALLPGGAAAQAPTSATFGSTLQDPANLGFGCEIRRQPGTFGPPFGPAPGFVFTNLTSCTYWPAPGLAISTYVPGRPGRIVRARVRSGDNPAPLQIAILSSGSGICCTMKALSQPFQPTPNAVTEVAVDLPVETGIDPTRPGGQFNDIVGVFAGNAVGPGTLPVFDSGVRGALPPTSLWVHGPFLVGEPNLDRIGDSGYETLLQVDWCATATHGGPLLPGCPFVSVAPPQPVPRQPTPASRQIRRASPVAQVDRAGRANVLLRCLLRAACRGQVTIRPRGGRATLGRASFTIPAGRAAAVRVPLTAAIRRALAQRPNRLADAFVRMRNGAATTLRITLRRR